MDEGDRIGQKVMGNPASKKGGGGGGDLTFESRHLVGIFAGLVVLCAVFFSLGYGMGRTQFETTVNAAPIGKPAEPAAASPRLELVKPEKSAPAIPAPSDWSFPAAAEAKKPADRLDPPPPKPADRSGEVKVALNPAPAPRSAAPVAPVAAAPSRDAAKMKVPAMPRGSIVLQVAALTKEGDALALAEALQRKSFPSFVLQPMGDNFYRVQVGPYADTASAEAGKKALFREGFKAILKK